MAEKEPISIVSHPYYPQDASLPHYVPNTKSAIYLISTFAAPLAVIAVVAFVLAGQGRTIKRGGIVPLAERIAFTWLIISGTIHIGFEGYFVVNHRILAGDSFILGQIWKEYALSDSRYLRSDLFTLTMEGITAAIDGPLCYLAARAIFTRSPHRHLLQLTVSLCQIYGLVLYYLTEVFAEKSNSNPHWLYYWVYFVGINFCGWLYLSG
ncbi:Emopamil binding protein-domain-containing protein [Syncephalis fuscata]|nr:Emopamil binding protein-domain-containing protein [Syncephalis fuscata]